MTRPKREKPDPHIVFVDTSTLFFEDKGPVVDPAFDSFWARYSSQFELELRVPEVVRGELLYQHCTKAFGALSNANQYIEEVSHITEKKYSHRVSDDRVKKEIETKFDAWVSGKNASILRTPINTIVWDEIVQRALWRRPPFSAGKAEKGFRDALILETIIHECASERSRKQIVFLCKDRLLKDSADTFLERDDRYVSFEYINEFKSYLDLKNEELESKFIRKITARANEKFFNLRDDNCLLFRVDFTDLVEKKYSRYFEDPRLSEKSNFIPGLLSPSVEWVPVTHGKFWVSYPQFVRKDDGGDYIWMSTVTFVRVYSKRASISSPFEPEEPSRVLILPFCVTWSSKVTSDARFLSTALLEVELEDNEFRAPTNEEREKWELGDP